MRNKRLIIIFSVLLSVTLLVLLSSIIFSVKSVVANCYNYTAFSNQSDSAALNEAVIANTPLKGKSVFLIDEKAAISHIEEKVPTVKVVSIERVFPNVARVHYVKMFSYFETKIGNTYYEFLCNGKVVKASPSKSENDRINIIAGLTKNYNVGDTILDSFLTEAATAFERLGLSYESAAVFFEFMDLSKENDVVYVGIRNTNTVFKIYEKHKFFENLRLAYSYYCSNEYNDAVDTMITVINGRAFSDDSRYLP